MTAMWGQVDKGHYAITVISVTPGSISSIGFACDLGLENRTNARLRVAFHDKFGWVSYDILLTKDKPKVWIGLPDKSSTDVISIQRYNDDTEDPNTSGANAAVAWDAH